MYFQCFYLKRNTSELKVNGQTVLGFNITFGNMALLFNIIAGDISALIIRGFNAVYSINAQNCDCFNA